ncbi:MAG: thioesterase family protein [Acidobacteria bacterium]|nr:thioesterase family protein [Acidobacteriota bacterium]
MTRDGFQFSHTFRVRYSEVDPQAVVFNARYLDYADLGVTEYWRALGISFAPGENFFEVHVVKATVEFRAPIRYDEQVVAYVRTSRIGRTSLTTQLELHGATGDDLRAVIEQVQVHVDLKTGRPQPVPDWVIERMEQFEGRNLRS